MDTQEIKNLHCKLLESISGTVRIDFGLADVVDLVPSPDKQCVADSPSKSYLGDVRGCRTAVLILSSHVSPQLVARSVAKARDAKRALSDHLGDVVLEPIVADVFRGLSFAVWPLQRGLSSLRMVRGFQRRLLRRRALCWLQDATRHTMRSDIGPDLLRTIYVAPLERVAEDGRLPPGLRDAAFLGLGRIRSAAWNPVTVLQHSDLWLGNFLLPLDRNAARPSRWGFYIIDWAGAMIAGQPFIDLVRFCMSSGTTAARLGSEIAAHCRIVQCEPRDAISYSAAALGTLGMNLEHFPESRYLGMCRSVYDHVSAVV